MQRKEGEARMDEWKQVAAQLASTLASARKESKPAETAEVVKTMASIPGAANAPGLGALTGMVQELTSAVKKPAGALGWLANLNPVLGLMRLFGGGGKAEPVELPKYERPARQSVTAGISAEQGWRMQGVDYEAGGRARAVESGSNGAQAPAQVTVQVQAMDSRSFLDHRDEIAAAVRQALLESHTLGDVLGER